MGDFLVFGARGERGEALSTALRAGAAKHDVAATPLSGAAWLTAEGPCPPVVRKVGAWNLIGRSIPRRAPPVVRATPEAPHAYEMGVIARFWGGYVGVRMDGDGVPAAVLRDPSGALDCFVWTQDGVQLIGSHLPDWALDILKPSWSIAFDRLHEALHSPLTGLGPALFDGPSALMPGSLMSLTDGVITTLWRPDWIARAGEQVRLDDETAADRLRDAIDEAVAGLAAASGPLAAEVSGGLDSSLVAASLKAAGVDVALWLNIYGRDLGSDERDHVAHLADHLGIQPSLCPRAEGVVTPALLRDIPQGFRPPFSALDGLHDADWAERLKQAGIQSVMTGKGGDGLLVQPAGQEVFGDLWRSKGWRSILAPALPALARWNETSVWALIAQARRVAAPEAPNPLLTPLGNTMPPRPGWLDGVDDLGPAKQLQIMAALYGVGLHGPSLQSQAVEVLHPLLATPVVETCLALPTPQLTLGFRDRALARRAFRHRLPPATLDRRSKGEMSAFYGRMIDGGLSTVRTWIMDGRLAERGLIDRDQADALLATDSLIWRGGYSDLMLVAGVEGWVRAWEARLTPPA